MRQLMGWLALGTMLTFFIGIPLLAFIGHKFLRVSRRRKRRSTKVKLAAIGWTLVLLAVVWAVQVARGFSVTYSPTDSPDGRTRARVQQRWAFDCTLVVSGEQGSFQVRVPSGQGSASAPKDIYWLPTGTAIYVDYGRRAVGSMRDTDLASPWRSPGHIVAGDDRVVDVEECAKIAGRDPGTPIAADSEHVHVATPYQAQRFSRH